MRCGPLCTSNSGIILQIHQLSQHVAATRQPGSDSTDRDAEDRGDLFVTHAFETDEQDHLALFIWQTSHRPFKVAQLQRIPAFDAAVSTEATSSTGTAIPSRTELRTLLTC